MAPSPQLFPIIGLKPGSEFDLAKRPNRSSAPRQSYPSADAHYRVRRTTHREHAVADR